MPPKKKARTSNGNAPNNKLNQEIPKTMADVCQARHLLKDWVVEAYMGRHGFAQERKFPLDQGGTFLDVVRKCWDAMDFVETSLSFLKQIGLMDHGAHQLDFLEKYCIMKDWFKND